MPESFAAKGFEARAEGVGADCMGVQATGCQAETARREQIYLERRLCDHAPLVIDHAFSL
jgi:hypothetical protein